MDAIIKTTHGENFGMAYEQLYGIYNEHLYDFLVSTLKHASARFCKLSLDFFVFAYNVTIMHYYIG